MFVRWNTLGEHDKNKEIYCQTVYEDPSSAKSDFQCSVWQVRLLAYETQPHDDLIKSFNQTSKWA